MPTAKSYYIPMEKMQCLQDLIGGIPRATITGIVGAAEAGKSTCFMQAAVEVAKAEKGNILIFDTENKFHVFMHLSQGLSEKYGMDFNCVRVRPGIKKSKGEEGPVYTVHWEFEDDIVPTATNIFIVHCPDLTPISIMWGRGFQLKIYDSGKFKTIMLSGACATDSEAIPAAQFIKKHNCVVAMVDSVTNPLDEFPAVPENFPARSDATQNLMIQFHKVAAEMNIPILATFHESKNETGMFNKQLKIEGGKGVTYNLAFTLYMLLKNEVGLLPKKAAKPVEVASDMRALYVARAPGRKPWANVKYVTITDQGLKDGRSGAADVNEVEDDDEEQDEPVIIQAPKKPVIKNVKK